MKNEPCKVMHIEQIHRWSWMSYKGELHHKFAIFMGMKIVYLIGFANLLSPEFSNVTRICQTVIDMGVVLQWHGFRDIMSL